MVDRALRVAVDHFKVKKAVELMAALDYPKERVRETVASLIPRILESGTDTKELCRAYECVGEYQLAVAACIKHDYFQYASRLLKHLPSAAPLLDQCRLAYSLKYNELLKCRHGFQEKHARLQLVQAQKRSAATLTVVTR